MTDVDEAVDLAKAVERLRILYEQYFAGVERFEPLKQRDKVKRELRRLMSARTNNTAYRFRLQTLQATLITHESHWDRIARQIEEGTFKRDKLKAQRHLAMMRDMTDEVELLEDEPMDTLDASDAFEELDADDALSALEADDGSAVQDLLTRGLLKVSGELGKPVPVSAKAAEPVRALAATVAASQPAPRASASQAPRSTPPAPAKPAARPADNGLDIKKLHEAFLAARSQTGETKPVSMETLADTIRKQTAAVKAQLGCENVEFKVAIKDGKAVLKAIPR